MALIKQKALQTHLVPVIGRFTSPLPAVGKKVLKRKSRREREMLGCEPGSPELPQRPNTLPCRLKTPSLFLLTWQERGVSVTCNRVG